MNKFNKSRCKHPPTKLFTVQGVSIYGGSILDLTMDILDYRNFIVLNIADCGAIGQMLKTFGKTPTWFSQPPSEYDYSFDDSEIEVRWPDYSSAPAELESPKFWQDLVGSCDIQGRPLLIACHGGHGRTGTATAMLRVAVGDVGWRHAIEDLRKTYCAEAVETRWQVDAIAQIDKRANMNFKPLKQNENLDNYLPKSKQIHFVSNDNAHNNAQYEIDLVMTADEPTISDISIEEEDELITFKTVRGADTFIDVFDMSTDSKKLTPKEWEAICVLTYDVADYATESEQADAMKSMLVRVLARAKRSSGDKIVSRKRDVAILKKMVEVINRELSDKDEQ